MRSELRAREQELANQRLSMNIVDMAKSSLNQSGSHRPPKKKLLCKIFGLQISLAIVINLFLVITVPTITVLLEYGVIPAKQTGFYCGDPLYSHKYAGDTVTPVTLGVTAFFLPALLVLLTEALAQESFTKMDLRRAWMHFRECLVGVTVVLLLTSVAKTLVGEHRPHFFDVCRPDTGSNCTEGQFVEVFRCTNKDRTYLELVDSSLSFPSGHSSITWFLGMVMAYIIQTRLTTVNTGILMKPFLISVCLTWALVCSLSRITDRRHHWWDVLAGTTIGILFSLVSMTSIRKKTLEMESELFDANDTDLDMV